MAIETEEDFINLVRKAEQEAEANPAAYTRKLALFGLLGYLVIFLVLIVLLGLAGGLVALGIFGTGLFILLLKKKLIFVVLCGIWILLRALWVKFEPPRGYTLKRNDFPELFGELDTLSKQLNSLKIDEVILDRNLNASVVQHPRLGVFGWHKNYLTIGYQLLLTLSPDEMRSVLAHEFGHLSGNHSRFNGWIYRVRLTWVRVMSAFDRVDSWGGKLMARFFDWYSPQFEAYSFALARGNEYEADAISAELTSPEIATSALVNVYTTAPYLDQAYWDTYFQYADEQEQPPHAPFEGLSRFLTDTPLARETLLDRIREELTAETHYADTHPSLNDRIAALGTMPQVLPTPETTAAEAWLGDNNQKIMQDFDREWMSENLEAWKRRYDYVSNARKQLQEFQQAKIFDLSDENLWNYAYWSFEFESRQAALPLFRAYQERYPQDADAAFHIGLTLLAQDDPAGLDQLRLARKSASLVERSAHLGYDFLRQRGEEQQAEIWWQESVEENRVFVAAREERESISASDNLVTPRIDDELLQQLIAGLKQQRKVGKVWLAQKSVRHFPEHPVYVIAFTPRGFSLSYDRIQEKVAENLDMPVNIFVVCKAGDNKALAKKVIKAGDRIL